MQMYLPGVYVIVDGTEIIIGDMDRKYGLR